MSFTPKLCKLVSIFKFKFGILFKMVLIGTKIELHSKALADGVKADNEEKFRRPEAESEEIKKISKSRKIKML